MFVRYHTESTVFPNRPTCKTILPPGSGQCMYDLNVVRQICRDINAETDPLKIRDLVALLRAVLREDRDEVRLRLAFLARRYGLIESKPEIAA